MRVQGGYSYDDVLLVPSYSDLSSRSECSLKSSVADIKMDFPVISAPMDTVTEESMATFMWENGGFGVVHRYNSVNKQFGIVKWVRDYGVKVGAAIGINGDSKERADALAEADVNVFVLDIAHGHMQKALDFVIYLKEVYPTIPVMSANIVTVGAAADYILAGADALRVGVGPGSACSTRQVAGVGFPQLSAISDIYEYIHSHPANLKIDIVADGGIRTSGDVVKALAAGADAVMLGGILAPFSVAAGKHLSVKAEKSKEIEDIYPEKNENSIERYIMMKEFRGMASESALGERKNDYVVEGESFLVPVRYDHKEFIKTFYGGIQQGFAYLGAKDISTLRSNAAFVEVSHHGYIEGTPHFKGGG